MSEILQEGEERDQNESDVGSATHTAREKEKPKGIAVDEFSWTSNVAKNDPSKKIPQLNKRQKTDEQKYDKETADVSGSSAGGDICRICHMGGFPPLSDTPPIWEWQNQGVRRVSSQISTLSSYAYLGPLISACKCRGSVALVHAECLERWLTESGHTRCELCGHKYLTKRVPRYGILASVGICFKTVFATRQMLLDFFYLLVTTPLALFSCYICALALRVLLESGFHEIPWMVIAMLPTCSLTLIAYWGWLITLGRYTTRLHSRRWRRFWRNNFVVRLMPDNSTEGLRYPANYPQPGPPISIIVNVVEELRSQETERDNQRIENCSPDDDDDEEEDEDEDEEFFRIM